MNAKKIMGAVLVALLALTAFAGAGAAATDLGTITTYTDLTGGKFKAGQTFYATDGTAVTVVSFNSAIYFAADEKQLNKKYTGYDLTFKLVAPTAVVAALDINGVDIIGKTVSSTVAKDATFSYTFDGSTATNSKLIFIDEEGVMYHTKPQTFQAGKWGVAADLTGNSALVTPSNTIVMGQVYYFTVAKTEASITAVKDIVNVGEMIVLKIQYPGAPNGMATVGYDDKKVKPVKGQVGVTIPSGTVAEVYVDLDIDGTAIVAFESTDKGNAKFTLTAPGNPKVTVEIKTGVITVVADEDSYFTGNAIGLSGTTTAGSDLFFYIEGTNFPLTQINSAAWTTQHFATDGELEVEKNNWTAAIDSTIKYKDGQKLVAGTYTVIVSTYDLAAKSVKPDMSRKESVMDETYGIAAVTLTQPFIENVKADAVAIQELDYEITGTAYSAENINVYIFGTNFFLAEPATVDTDEETFKFTLKGGETKKMDVGTYFYLIQHPMGDKLFNVWNNATSIITAAKNNPFTAEYADFFYAATAQDRVDNSTFIFNAYERGTNYAAQALLEEIAGQKIDDVFVQGTFKVEAQKLTINPIPAQVAQGTSLTVSGTSNCGEGTEVIVNVYEGTFGATVKGDENAATFLTNKAVTKADGTWEAAIDTSKLKLGTYTVTVELNGQQFDSESVEIVAAAPSDEPSDEPADEPSDEPQDEPTDAPETPGFGALAALAGLGAVAVLLLRRE